MTWHALARSAVKLSRTFAHGTGVSSRRARPPCLRRRCQHSASASKDGHEVKSIRPFSEIPGPTPSLPFIGTGWQYFPWAGRYNLFKLHEANIAKYKAYGDILKEEYQWRKPVVQLYNPNDFETVFRHQGTYPLRPITEFLVHYRKRNPQKYSGPGIANAVGQEWKRLRNVLASPMLKTPVFYNDMQSYNRICDDFVNLLRTVRHDASHEVQNLQGLAYRLALESTCMLCLDSRLGCLRPDISPDSDGFVMISAVQKLFEAFQELYYGLPFWKYFNTSSLRKLHEAECGIYDTATRYVERALQRIKGSEESASSCPRGSTLLETMLQSSDFSDLESKLSIVDFIAGGIFTVSNTLCFLLHHLATNPDVQEKLHNEIVATFPDGVIAPESMSKLVYLKACVKETFRLTPTVPGIMRILPEDVVLSGYHVPAGVVICCHFMVTCRMEKYFWEPERFCPDRWIGNNRQSIHPFCLLPFGHGTRMCLGRRFAETELYLAAAKMAYNFHLESRESKLDLIHPFIIVPANPISIVVRDRQSGS